MNKNFALQQLNTANNGEEILSILDILLSGDESEKSSREVTPTLDEIKF